MENRTDLLNTFIEARNFQSYLEIGVDNHWNFDYINVAKKESVDPRQETDPTYEMTSDEFWNVSKNHYDIIFIDGLHQGDQAYRDILGALDHLSRPDSVIVLHDCNPDTAVVGLHDYLVSGPWMGDVWTAFSFYRLHSDKYCYTVDMDCGCGVIDLSRVSKNVCVGERVRRLYNSIDPENVCYLSYQVLEEHREELLGFVSPEEFLSQKLQESKLS